MSECSEATVENVALSWFEGLGYEVLFRSDIAIDSSHPERYPATGRFLKDQRMWYD